MLVQFLKNSDSKTVTMLVDHQIISSDIPYVPERYMDHRGSFLHHYAEKEGLMWQDFSFEDSLENPEAVRRNFMYMKNPFYVWQAIRQVERLKRKRA